MITIDELSVKMEATKLFAIWLDGFLEACGNKLNEDQTEVVRGRLNNLFHHEAETVESKPTLEDLGKQHGFDVKQGFPGSIQPSDENGILYRC
jgi:hypothetical protein